MKNHSCDHQLKKTVFAVLMAVFVLTMAGCRSQQPVQVESAAETIETAVPEQKVKTEPLIETPEQAASKTNMTLPQLSLPETEEAEVAGTKSDKPIPAETAVWQLIDINDADLAEAADINAADVNSIEEVCRLIYAGLVDAADEAIEKTKQRNKTGNAYTELLSRIIRRYEDIEQKRREAKQAGYEKKLAELEKLYEQNSDINDVNDLRKTLSVLVRVCESAERQDKEKLLRQEQIKKTISLAEDTAYQFESEGKWFDAYINCYSWLKAIDSENELYSEHTEQVLDKATIVASFQDSPCETRKERYSDVKEQMLVRAVNVLSSGYVRPPDYGQMAEKALKRCRLLAEVVKVSFYEITENGTQVLPVKDGEEKLSQPSDEQIFGWAEGLKEIAKKTDNPAGISKDEFVEVFHEVLKLNKKTIKLPERLLTAHFAEAGLSGLDPYTVMVWPKQVDDFEKLMTNEFSGIGVEITKENGLLTISSLMPGTPAYNSGLDAKDIIEKVDGVETKDMSLICAVKNITGPAGTDVTLTVRSRQQDENRDIVITRAKISVPTIRGWKRTRKGEWLYMLDRENKIAYVRIAGFSEKTAADFEKVISRLETMNGLILDLRFNTGGLLKSAIDVVDMFVDKGMIVSTRPRFGIWTWASAHQKGTHPDYPLVILINSSSASASEIVAGALADKVHSRAILVGERTHGKGSVQGITNYTGGGSQLKYTIAYYHLPSGQRVKSRNEKEKQDKKDWGVKPDIEVVLTTDELRKMIDIQRGNDMLVKAAHNEAEAPILEKHTAEETLAADVQLAVGVLAVKTELLRKHLASGEIKTDR